MVPKEVKFTLDKRVNVHRKSKKEYALKVRIDGQQTDWTIMAWENKPSDETLEEMKNVIMRSFSVYHSHIRFPSFELKIVND